MTKINALVPYHYETFGRQTGHNPSRDGQAQHAHQQPRQAPQPTREAPQQARPGNGAREVRRQPAFLVQMMTHVDPDLRKSLGRRDLADQRETAYGQALATRPSARPLSFLRIVETA